MRLRSTCRLAAFLLRQWASGLLGLRARGPDTEYGSSRGNEFQRDFGLRRDAPQRGHEVRPAIRLTEELAEWAQGIVRFATYPGPPAQTKPQWYDRWLAEDPDRWLIYVVRDFDARREYWRSPRTASPRPTSPTPRRGGREALAAADWVARLPAKAEDRCSTRGMVRRSSTAWLPRDLHQARGYLGQGDRRRGRPCFPLHEPLRANRWPSCSVTARRSCWTSRSARAAILRSPMDRSCLNEGWSSRHAGRWPSACSTGPRSTAQRVALLEGSFVLEDEGSSPDSWELCGRLPSVALGRRPARSGRSSRRPALGASPGPPPAQTRLGADRPAAHAVAIGALLARGREPTEARRTARPLPAMALPDRIAPLTNLGVAAQSALVDPRAQPPPAPCSTNRLRRLVRTGPRVLPS